MIVSGRSESSAYGDDGHGKPHQDGRGRFGMKFLRLIRSPGAMRVVAALGSALLAIPATAVRQSEDGGNSSYVIPLFTSADSVQEGLARVVNHSDRAGTVRIFGTDDSGGTHGPVTLHVDARATRHLDSSDLESGNAAKGLSEGLGDGDGSWRLRLETELEIEVGAYLQAPDGFLSAVHDVVRTLDAEGETVHHVPIFNDGTDGSPVSWLQVSNLGDADAEVTIRGHDDDGEPAPGGEVRLTLPARASRRISAQQLELGDAGLDGRLGDGEGRWRLSVTADGKIDVVSLLRSPAGHLANLSGSALRPAQASAPGPEVGTTFHDCAGCPEMMVVPAGSYPMGSPTDETDRDPDEGPVHQVTIGEPFAVGRHEVTFAQWDACHAAGGCFRNPDDQGWGRGNRPVVDVSWLDAQEYVAWLSESTGYRYRLPSESEWEYVARAGTTTRYWWGDAIGENRANCNGCGSAWDNLQTAPVGSFSPNSFGLHDVHGNVWERVQDCWNASYGGAPSDGSAWESGECEQRVRRGGGWSTLPQYLRGANRAWVSPPGGLYEGEITGFRVVRALAPLARHTIPLFLSVGSTRQGFARIINRSRRAGAVRVHGTDDAGEAFGPTTLHLAERQTRHFDSFDLAYGNASNGLPEGLGEGTGHWRLELTTELDIEASAYIRTSDGFLTAMHDVVRSTEVDGSTMHRVPIFNPASNRNQASWLHVANPTRAGVDVTIRGRDDDGQPAPGGEVRLTLPARTARRISAEQLESGDDGFTGRLGDGEGKWQLFVTADGTIEVVNLLQSATGHLSNLSSTARGGFEIVASGPSTVRPLQTIHLVVPGGLGDSDYTVLMDLSGTGVFAEDDTVEIEGLTTDDDRILFASPLTQILPEANTLHQIAVRVRREANQATSNVLRYSIDEIASVAGPPGFPTMVFEAIQKSLYATVDDPLLNLEAASIQPGLVTWSAAQLDVDTRFSDVLAEAFMQSLFGIPVTEIAPGPVAPASAADLGADYTSQLLSASAPAPAADPGAEFASQVLSVSAVSGSDDRGLSLLCDWVDPLGICSTVKKMMSRVEEFNEDPQFRCDTGDSFDQAACLGKRRKAVQKVTDGVVSDAGRGILDGVIKAGINVVSGVAMGTLVSAGKGKVIRDLRKNKGDKVAERALEGVHVITTVKKYVEHGVKVYRVVKAIGNDGETERSNSGRDFDETGRMTKQGLKRNFQSLKSVVQSWKQKLEELIPEVEKDFAAVPNLDDDVRESFSVLMNDIDRQRREAESLDDLEGVYEEEQDPRDAIGNDPDRGVAVAANCRLGYREFPLEDGKLSTCVVESLVEEDCYKGSRRASDVDLGESEDCLYYSLDFIQSDGSCRENYAKVFYQGRWTCRWAALASNQPHAYTLDKTQGTQAPQTPVSPPPDGGSKVVPPPQTNVPPPPDVSGLESGCHGQRDSANDRVGRWVCKYSFSVTFETYQDDTLHGPSGGYDSNGKPSGSFGSYQNGKKNGLWRIFYSSGAHDFYTYQDDTLHGPSGGYDSNGKPSGSFGSYQNGKKNGLWRIFYSSGAHDFYTYQDDTLHGPSGGYDSNGKPSGSFGSYQNGKKNGLWRIFYSSGAHDFYTYQDDTLHGPSGGYDSNGKPSGSFGSYQNGKKNGLWRIFYSSGAHDFYTYQDDTLHGPSGGYDSNGKRSGSFGSYQNGRRTGTWTYFVAGEETSTVEY